MNSTALIILIVVIVVVVVIVAALAALLLRRRRSAQLKERFGAEYDRSVADSKSKGAGEAELRDREKRHSKLDIRPLEPAEQERFRESWQQVQAGFVDRPAESVRDADRLVIDIMRKRGYPMDDFEQRSADISVDHPSVVENYRKARRIAVDQEKGNAGTEELRQAVTSYRSLIDALLQDGGHESRAPGRTQT